MPWFHGRSWWKVCMKPLNQRESIELDSSLHNNIMRMLLSPPAAQFS